MPTIELTSIGCSQPPALPTYCCFTYSIEINLRSHRGLFQPVFDTLNGVIVHLANKELECSDAGWFAGKLIDWEESCLQRTEKTHPLVFPPDVSLDIRDLMQRLLAASPQRHITFSSDYQFGGERYEHGKTSLSRFFELQASRELCFNHLWHIIADA